MKVKVKMYNSKKVKTVKTEQIKLFEVKTSFPGNLPKGWEDSFKKALEDYNCKV